MFGDGFAFFYARDSMEFGKDLLPIIVRSLCCLVILLSVANIVFLVKQVLCLVAGTIFLAWQYFLIHTVMKMVNML